MSDWAGGPDADEEAESPTSSEIQLDPHQPDIRGPRGRNTELQEKQSGMDFMTSALESKNKDKGKDSF